MLDTVKLLSQEIRGQDVFLVAGGHSIHSIDLSILKDKKIIAVNNSFELFENATAIFWADASWADNNYRALEPYPCKLRFTSRKRHKANNLKGQYGVTTLSQTGDMGYDPDANSVRGNNSGVQALNLVVNLKPKRIFLLGYDMRAINGKTHWHNKHILAVPPDVYSDLFIPSMNSMADALRKLPHPPEIINCSEFSALTCFKKDNINNFFGKSENDAKL